MELETPERFSRSVFAIVEIWIFLREIILQNLAANDAPPPICGKPIPQGQALYGCRDCGQDDTCVMCSDCFNVSAHKNHNYRYAKFHSVEIS